MLATAFNLQIKGVFAPFLKLWTKLYLNTNSIAMNGINKFSKIILYNIGNLVLIFFLGAAVFKWICKGLNIDLSVWSNYLIFQFAPNTMVALVYVLFFRRKDHSFVRK